MSPLIKARSTVYLLLLLYCPLLLTLSKAQSVINVDWGSGDNNMSCLSGEEIACKTLDYALNYVNTSDVIIRIASGTQYIMENAILTGISDILIEGDQTQVNCTGYNSGIEIIGVSDLVIRGITFSGCGVIHTITIDESVSFQSGVYILNCTNLTLTNITITDTTGIGLVILDTSGTVLIENSHFTNNIVTETDQQHFAGGGGVYIELTKCSPGFGTTCSDSTFNPFAHNSSYTIRDCVFDSNTAVMPLNSTLTFVSDHGPVLQSLGRGGGLSLSLKGESSGNIIEITMCSFKKNSARVGGGLAIGIDDRASSNIIRITSDGIISDIWSNTAVEGGGGVQFGFFNAGEAQNNSVMFVGVHFVYNKARYGGGLSLYATRSRTPFGRSQATQNNIIFKDCLWAENIADIGAAVVLFPEDWTQLMDGHLPKPVFHNCEFDGNYILFDSGYYEIDTKVQFANGGTIFSDSFSLTLSSSFNVTGNSGSGIFILAGDVEILPNTFVNISGNYANKGGGIALISSAAIIAYENTTVIFDSNNVSDVGGAIYYSSSDTLDIVNSRRCFVRYKEILPPDEWKTNFTFINNTATYGSTIYADSLWPCAKAGVTNGSTADANIIHHVFKWRPFTFKPDLDSSQHIISTAPFQLELGSISVPPGITSSLHINIKDDLNQTMKTVLLATCDYTCKGDIDSSYRYISDDYDIAFTGDVDDTLQLTLQTIDTHAIGIKVQVTLASCPPGYVHTGKKCECSVSSNHHIPGIVACHESNGTSHGIMKLGYWAGCMDTDNGHTKLFTAQCPLGYCDYNIINNGLVTLPSDCGSLSSVNESLCSTNRQGTMCGDCTNGTSVYYHSTRFKCEECDSSDRYLGILYYILSELLPLTVLFLVVIIFDISVTSGPVNSFILFAQVMDFFEVTAFGSYNLPGWIQVLTDIYWFFFGFLNLEFFRLDFLSFCIWDGITVLDVLAIKYLTSLYGLLLILILFLVMKYCSCRLLRRCLGRGNSDGRYSIVNGISTFLIITYSQVTKVSFEILTRVDLSGERDSILADNSRVFLSGETVFFGKDHLPYAIPAIFVMFFAVLLPLFLIGHPLYLKIKQFLLDRRIIQESTSPESRFCQWLSGSLTKLDLSLMPIRDVFQSCFKDNMRFFAGLFFLYRLLISASFAFSTTAVAMYSLLELVVIMMLALNAIFQPYQRKFYNILDTLIFVDLAIINGISLFNFASTQFISDQEHFNMFAALQVILIYIPVFYVAVFLTLKLLAAKCHCVRFKLRKANRYIPLFDTRLLDMDEREQEDENRQLIQNASFSGEHYPTRVVPVYECVLNKDDSSLNREISLDRDLRLSNGHGRGQYGTLDLHD